MYRGSAGLGYVLEKVGSIIGNLSSLTSEITEARGGKASLNSKLSEFVSSEDSHNIPAGGTTGQFLGKLSAVDYDATWLTNDSCLIVPSATQSIPDVTATVITLDTVIDDNNSMLGVNRVTIKKDGKYLIVGKVDFDSNATGIRLSNIRKNGTTYLKAENIQNNNGASTHCVVTSIVVASLVAGDYIELIGYQNSGGSLSTVYSTDNLCSLSVIQL